MPLSSLLWCESRDARRAKKGYQAPKAKGQANQFIYQRERDSTKEIQKEKKYVD
jgi:hypothetical protein